MTEEQFKRACEINERLCALDEAKKEIHTPSINRIFYTRQEGRNYRICDEWKMEAIRELLDKHDKMIREEIEEEIRNLQEEIKKL